MLVGPSGCGKSTTLRMMAGLEEITEGELYIGDALVNHVAPKSRDIAMVFQNYALYPHMTVFKNMAFGLQMRKTPKDEIRRRVVDAAKKLGIEHLLGRRPKALSGGERQRVALGRAMVRNPAVFLLDEPLSNLDAKLRTAMRTELIQLHQRLKTTFVYVTHDQTEAMTMADRIVVMKDGVVQQIGTPQQVYDTPANVFVAGFIGAPQMNLLDGILQKNGAGQLAVSCAGQVLNLPAAMPDEPENAEVHIGIRPEAVRMGSVQKGTRGAFTASAKVNTVELLGNEKILHLDMRGNNLVARVPANLACKPGDVEQISVSVEDLQVFFRKTGERVKKPK